jgi:hypothetical protein
VPRNLRRKLWICITGKYHQTVVGHPFSVI